ncbi:MAG TPA: sigma-70 family RNA polymerase sigma factor [Actinomycetota bacterium]|nr:sigma-70 family RNA polymerase sigma factor [Actinomycetota bacterium]
MATNIQELEHEFVTLRPDLVSAVNQRLRDPQEAEDVVQETFCRAIMKAAELDIERIGGWLRVVALRLAIDNLRRRHREVAVADHDHPQHDPALDTVVDNEFARTVSSFLEDLPEPQRAVLNGVAAGRTLDEIAIERGSTKRSIEGHLRRGRSRLRRLSQVT